MLAKIINFQQKKKDYYFRITAKDAKHFIQNKIEDITMKFILVHNTYLYEDIDIPNSQKQKN